MNFTLLCGFFFLLPLICDFLYSVSLKTLPFFKSGTLFYDSVYSLSFLSQAYIHLFNIVTHLEVCYVGI